jgi:DNA (cytosine-5)-methyltransferase 1
LIYLNNKYKTKLSQYSFIDLFAGIGGFRLALESFGAKCVFSSEFDRQAKEVYHTNHGEIPHGDITQINEKEIPKHNILCGGFPCQAFSISGKQKGFQDTRGTLFFDISRIVKHHKPKVLLLENVKNFEKHDNGNTLKTVINTLNDLDYSVFYDVLNASDFGVPQSRKRIYIIAFHNSLNIKEFIFPQSNGIKTKLIDFLEDNNKIDLDKYIIQRNDIQFKSNLSVEKDSHGHYPQKPVRIGTISKGGQGERIYHPLGHAITLSAYGGGVAGKTGCYHINGVNRRLTEKEVLKISGYPEYFKHHPSKSQTYKQFGNTVVVNVLQEIIKKVIDENIL